MFRPWLFYKPALPLSHSCYHLLVQIFTPAAARACICLFLSQHIGRFLAPVEYDAVYKAPRLLRSQQINILGTVDTYTHTTSDMHRKAAEIVGNFLTDYLGEEMAPWQSTESAATAASI